MKKVKQLFGNFNMSWLNVIIFSIITAVITAVLNVIPALEDTSFTDIAVNLECWFLFAIFIIVNCKKWWEASLKCFVFFLVSQPLIYLIEVPFKEAGWSLFSYYKYWFIITLLTLPGAAIAFFVKKKNWLSVLILSVANGYLAYSTVTYFKSAMSDFPYHLLSAIFCFLLALFFVFVLLDDKKQKIAAIIFVAVVIVSTAFIEGRNTKTVITLDNGSWSYTVDDQSVIKVELENETNAKLTAKHDGNTYLRFKNSKGEEKLYLVTVSGGGIWVDDLNEN